MDRALWMLLAIRLRAGLRRRWRSLRTPQGLVLSLVGFAFVLAWVGTLARPARSTGGEGMLPPAMSPSLGAADALPLLLLTGCLITLATTSGPAIYFSPAEVHFLFAGPFRRRDLLVYKFVAYAAGALLTSLCVSVCLVRTPSRWPAVFVGTFLTLLFMQLFSAGLGLSAQRVAMIARRSARWAAVVLAAALLAAAVWHASGEQPGTHTAKLQAVRASVPGRILLSPFTVFSRIFLAENVPSLLAWAGLACCINAGLLGAVLWLDADYYEAAEAASERMRQRWQRFHRGRVQVDAGLVSRVRIPQLPYWAGAGPLAWRQFTTALRTCPRTLLATHLGALAAGLAYPLFLQQAMSPWSAASFVLTLSVLVVPKSLCFDFRGDVDRLGWLKSLPFPPTAIVVGQLLTPTLLATSIHAALLGGIAITAAPFLRGLLLAMALIALPANFLHYNLENLSFLLFPSRIAPMGRVDFEFFGRTIVEAALKITAILAALIGGGCLGVAVSRAAGDSFAVAAAVCWLFVFLAGLVAASLVVCAFRRLDVSRHTPS